MRTSQQQEAIDHLTRWRVGALFMQPGTGKTRVAVELVNGVPADRVLWVGPLRTLRKGDPSSTVSEIDKWGGLRVPTKYVGIESIQGSDRIYGEVADFIDGASAPFIVVDESLKIKNSEAKRTRRMLELSRRAEYKLILNGTPVSRNLLDMWPQMEFLSPKILGMSLSQFKNTFCVYDTVAKRYNGREVYSRDIIRGYDNIDYLYSLIGHYVYECDMQMNVCRLWNDLSYEIDKEAMEEYQEIKEAYLNHETLSIRDNNIFLEMTQKMQHSYCASPAKFKVLDDLFRRVPEEKTVIFCKFVKSRIACEGRYPSAAVLSYQREAFGLNLQDRCHTVFFDKTWDFAVRDQAGRRTFRTGQTCDCRYYDLSGNVGLEKMIDRCIARKTGMAEYLKKLSLEQMKKEL